MTAWVGAAAPGLAGGTAGSRAGLPVAVPAAVSGAVLVLAAVVLVLVGVVVVERVLRHRRAERLRRRTEPLRPLLLELVAGEPDEQSDAAARLTALAPRVWRSVEPAVVALLSKVRGDSRGEVVALLEARGVLQRSRADVRRRGAVRRARAAELLGAAGDVRSVPALVALLEADRSGEVRLVAARALGRIAAAEAATPLLAALHEEHGRSRVPPQVVASALLRIGPAAADDLVAALADGSAAVRATACEILGRVGAVGSVTAVRQRLREDGSAEVRARAATALGRLGMPAALVDLLPASGSSAPGAVRACAVRALGELGDPRAVPALRDLLADADGQVAALAGPALVALGGPGRTALHAVVTTGTAVAADVPGGGALVVARAHEALALARLASAVPQQRGPSSPVTGGSRGRTAVVGA